MSDRDTYKSYQELSEGEERRSDGEGDYRIEVFSGKHRISEVVILAPHGGKIEPHTSTIAHRIAGEDFALYLFEGTKSGGNFADLHLTSTRFDEPRCLELLEKARAAVAVHGKKESRNGVLVGGRDDELAGRIAERLRGAGFVAKRTTSGPVCGMKKSNICNRTATGKGVQLEIYRDLRRALVKGPEETLLKFAHSIRAPLLRRVGDQNGG